MAAAQLFFWIHPSFPQAPWSDVFLDVLAVLAGPLTLWLLRSSRLRPAAWTIVALCLVASTVGLFVEGQPVTDIAGRSGLLLTVALAFVLLERRGAWFILTASVGIFALMHALWWGGYLPQPIARNRLTQLVFSVAMWTTTATVLGALLYSAMRALRERVKELSLLHEVGQTISRTLDLDALWEAAVESLHRSFGYHNVGILALSDEQEALTVKALAGELASVVSNDYVQSLDTGLAGWAGRHTETVLVNDVTADPRYINRCPEKVHTRSELCVPICTADKVIGVLDVQSDHRDAFDQSDVRVLETLAGQIGAAMENARLYQAERAAHRQVSDLVTYLQNDREKERTHIAREVLDEFGQLMTVVQMDLSWLGRQLSLDHPQLVEKTRSTSNIINESLQVVRRLASQLRPGVLDHFGLAAAVKWQAQAFSEVSGIPHQLHVEGEADLLDPELSTNLFRIFQEALTNVEQHAQASHVRISLDVEPKRVTLVVVDDGRGITPEESADPGSLGLAGMRQRADALGGKVTIEGIPGEGTRVTTRIPRPRPESGTYGVM
jgi:signal transduction histidine kinase